MNGPVAGVDASRSTADQPTGTENYAREILRHLLRLPEAADIGWRLYFRAGADTLPAELTDRSNVVPMPLPNQRMWTHRALGPEVRRRRPDVLFVPAHVLPFAWTRRNMPALVMTIHDLGYRHFPKAHPWRQRTYLNLTTRWAAARAACLICDSEATRQDLIRFHQADPGRLHTVHLGWTPPSDPDPACAPGTVLAKFNLRRPFALFVSTLQPRKNAERLIHAYGRLHAREDPGWDLVLAGRIGWLAEPILAAARSSPATEAIHILGYVNEEDVAVLRRQARFFCYPSLHEGFGLPVLEAQSQGVPVLTSNRSSLPEVAGDAALLVDPEDVDEIAQAMLRLSRDEELRAELVAKGHENVKRFSWEKAARETLAVLKRAMNKAP